MKAREEFEQVAIKEIDFSGAGVARYIGVTASYVRRIAASRELPEQVRSKYQIPLVTVCPNVPHVGPPKLVEFRTSLPKSAIGKVLRKILREEETAKNGK